MRKYVFGLALAFMALAYNVQNTKADYSAGEPGTATMSVHRHIPVYNSDTDAKEVGDVVVWKDGSTFGDGMEITTTTTANNGLVAGVICEHTISGNGWGFVQTHGYHSGITIGVANSAGDSLVTSGTAEAAGVYSVLQATGTQASGEARTFGVFAVALEATTSSTTVKGFIYR